MHFPPLLLPPLHDGKMLSDNPQTNLNLLFDHFSINYNHVTILGHLGRSQDPCGYNRGGLRVRRLSYPQALECIDSSVPIAGQSFVQRQKL